MLVGGGRLANKVIGARLTLGCAQGALRRIVNVESSIAKKRRHIADDVPVRSMPARDRRALLYGLSLTLDCLALLGGYLTALTFRDSQFLDTGGQALPVLAIPIYVALAIASEAQSVEALESRSLGMKRAFGALFATAIAMLLLSFLTKAEDISRLGFGVTFASAALFIVAERLLLDRIFSTAMGGRATSELLLLDGAAAQPQPTMDVIDVGSQGIWPDLSRPDLIDSLSRMIADYDRVVVASRPEHHQAWAKFLKGSDVGGEILFSRAELLGAVAIGACGSQDTLVLSRGPLSLYSRLQKRAFDLAITVPLLLVLAVPLLLVALAIRLESKGPALFRQTRVGHGNRQFRIYKFRSMRHEASDSKGDRSTSRDDDRITRVGRFIRRTSIDELPQLLNVLKGDMSLVGPRPHALGSLAGNALFWEVNDSYWMRHALKPGITGLAQIRGFRGATDKSEDLEQRLRCDLEYLQNWSIGNDFLIFLKTLRVVVHSNAF